MPEKKKKFEDLMEELEKIVERLEGGELGLDAAMVEFEKGTKLLKECNRILAEAQKKIEMLTTVGDEPPKTLPFEPEGGDA